MLGFRAEDLTVVATPHFRDLDVQGEACSSAVMAVGLPNPDIHGYVQAQRRDVFVGCDLRPLGFKPVLYFGHSVTVHVPSVFAYAALELPTGYEVLVSGGVLQWPEVMVPGKCCAYLLPSTVVAPAGARESLSPIQTLMETTTGPLIPDGDRHMEPPDVSTGG